MTQDATRSPGRPVLTPAGHMASPPRARAISPWGRLYLFIRAAGADGIPVGELAHDDVAHLDDLVAAGYVVRETRQSVVLVAALPYRTGAVRAEEGDDAC